MGGSMGHIYDSRPPPQPPQGYSMPNMQGYNGGMYNGASPAPKPPPSYSAKPQNPELAEMKAQMNDAVERYKQLSDTMQRLATMMQPPPPPPPRQDSPLFWTACGVMGAALAMSMMTIGLHLSTARRS